MLLLLIMINKTKQKDRVAVQVKERVKAARPVRDRQPTPAMDPRPVRDMEPAQ